MLRSFIGHSDAVPPSEAIEEVIASCRKQLEAAGRRPKAGIFLTSVMHCDHAALLRRIMEAFPGLELIGCTTDGEISSQHDFAMDSMALLLLDADAVEFAVGVGRNVSQDTFAAAAEARDMAMARLNGPANLAVVLPDGLSTIASPLEGALRQAFGEGFPVYGGTAGDHFLLKQTWQFCGEELLTDSLPVLLLSGHVLHASGICSGWSPVGRKLRITRSEKNLVQSIDHMPAMEFYRHYLGDNVNEYIQFPLALLDEETGDFSLRDPLVFNEDGSIQFIGHFPDNAQVQLAEAGRSEILDAATSAASLALQRFPGERPELALAFSCTSRRQILGSRTCEECAALRSLAPPHVSRFGFYTYGEIGPMQPGGPTIYHNDTLVVLLLGEG